MILDEIVLENFGVYAGRQTIALTPTSDDRPIVLFGGKNGRGKTTFLEAIQLCLYGRFCNCSGRYKGGYHEFLRQAIHAGSGNTAAVELEFRHTSDGKESSYRLERRWTTTAKAVNEHFWVYKDGQEDAFLAEHWTEVVEGILPRRIADLFLFDGEKVEAHATPESAAELIATATHSLLGMDIVDQLEKDLRSLQQRKRKVVSDEQVRRSVEEAEQEYARLTEGIRERRTQLAGLRSSALITATKTLDQLQLDFMQKGGAVFERQEEIGRKWDEACAKVRTIEDELRKLAAEEAPLLLLGPLVQRLASQATTELRAQRERDILQELRERDQALGEVLAKALSAKAAAKVREFLESDIKTRAAAAEVPQYLCLSPRAQQQLSWLRDERLRDGREKLDTLLEAHKTAVTERAQREAEKDSIPAVDAIADLIQKRDEAKAAVAALRSQIHDLEEEIRKMEQLRLRTRQSLVKLLERRVKDDFEIEGAQRIVDYAEKVQATLAEFRSRAVRRHISRIEANISERFIQLIHKTSLVEKVSVDPDTFRMTISSPGDGEFPAERLSAGERQLLAISILWGLALASGRRLPTVIDTPLGRLDSDHRQNLVSRYFPHASHQVILLSTDQEITESYMGTLGGSIGRAYTLVYEDHKKGTVVYPGYFSMEIANAG